MKSIVRKDNGADSKEYLRALAKAEGMENPTDEELLRLDRARKDKKVSNQDWHNPNDPDARIAKMKDGRTHLAYKAEHAWIWKPRPSSARTSPTPTGATPPAARKVWCWPRPT